MYLTEAPSQYSPVKIDLDFRYMSSSLKRRYTIEQIIQIVELYMEQFNDWFYELDTNHRMVLIFEKENPRYKDSKDEGKEERLEDKLKERREIINPLDVETTHKLETYKQKKDKEGKYIIERAHIKKQNVNTSDVESGPS